ncbi:MAG: response regulator [Candidatus Omnitrophica bacterium]|nr:response regulator [Candidatus Omnitrophota bacterium]
MLKKILKNLFTTNDAGHKTFKIMIIEPQDKTINLFRQSLEKNYCIHFALNGKEGVKVANTVQPDFIFINNQLPDMTGCEVCSQLKTQTKFHDIPIIMIFSQVTPATIITCYESGADSYLTQPVGSRDIKNQVEVFIAEKE